MNRKEFLTNMGALAAGASLFPWLTACTPEKQKDAAGGKARLAIIGTGSRGRFHLVNLLEDDLVQVVALCDDYKPHLNLAAAMCPGARLYSDYHALLDDREVDGVIICTPLSMHSRMTIDSFAAGKHVFCEKALAWSPQQLTDMHAAWKASGKVLMVGQQRLYDPKYVKAMELVAGGAIGQVVGIRNYWYRNNDWRRPVDDPAEERRINWRLYQQYSRGLMAELACHQLQNGSWAMGGIRPDYVSGTGSIMFWKDGREVFDNVATVYQYPNGVHMTFDSIIANKHFAMGEQILGSEGTIDLVRGVMYSEQPRKRSGLRQMLDQIEQGILSNSAFAGSSWVTEAPDTDKGIRFVDNVSVVDGASSVGFTGDGSVELMHAYALAVITGVQPAEIVEEACWSTLLALLGDEATRTGTRVDVPKDLFE